MTYTPSTYTDFKNSVRAASTGNVSVSSPGASIDGVALASGNRILLKNQSAPAQNGVYIWMGAATPLVRAKDADQPGEMTAGATSYVEEGTANGKKTFTLTTTGAIVVGTTPITYEELIPNLGESSITELGDVDTTGAADGSLLRYEATGTQWQDTPNLLLNDAGQLQITTTGINGGLLLGGDTLLYRSAANVITVGAGDKIQQNAAPTANDDLTNKLYVDAEILAATPDFDQAFRRSWFGVG